MAFRTSLVLVVFATALTWTASLEAQTALVARDAELAVPFGGTRGQLALVGDDLVFVSTENPTASISINRADISTLDRSGDVVTIRTRAAIRDASGARDTFRFRLDQPADLVRWFETERVASRAPAAAPATPASAVLASYQVKHDHRLGSCQGTLVLASDRVSFESIDEIDDSRQWELRDIKEVKQDGVYRLKIEPFLGDTFNFELTGKGMDSGEYRRLVDRIARARSSR